MSSGFERVIGGACVVLAVVGVVVVGCGAPSGRASMGAVAEGGEPGRAFEEKFLEAAREYGTWKRVFHELKGAQIQCRAFTTEDFLRHRAPLLSESKDESTHGRKLFWLYAKEINAYQKAFDFDPPSDLAAPIGQVLVKQSWSMKPVEKSWVEEGENRTRCVVEDGNWFATDEKRELFVMMKLPLSVAGTDRGWVYGVVSADGSKVVRSGMLEDCMGCHRKATHDRQLGFDERE